MKEMNRAIGILILTVVLEPCFGGAMDDLRIRWREMLIGGANLDTTIPQVRSRLSSMQSTANREWSTLDKSAGRQALWSDLASATNSADVSSNYGRLHDMA